MSIRDLPGTDLNIALECLLFVRDSSEFEDSELDTRVGVTRAELGELIEEWPNIEDESRSDFGFLALKSCFNEVCNGVQFSVKKWQKWFSVSRDDVRETFSRWLLSVDSNNVTDD